jgi:hypothetical protein
VCLLCDQLPETVDHLLVACLIAREAYWLAFSWARCACSFGGQDTVCDWWKHLVNSQTARRKGARSLFMIVAGKFGRNATLEFEHRSAPTSVILARIKNEAELCGSTQVRASFFSDPHAGSTIVCIVNIFCA